MKILFIVPYTPNPIRVRPYELLRTLAGLGHQVTLATLWQSEEERQALRPLAAIGVEIVAQPLTQRRSLWNCLQALPSQAPIQAAYCWQPSFAQQLRRLVVERAFDIIHVEHLRGVRYGLTLKATLAAAGLPVPIIWDSVDCISHLFAQAATHSRSRAGRFMTRLELERTRRYEGWLLTQFDQVLVTSSSDRQALLTLATARTHRGQTPQECINPIAVLPNGVDLEQFQAQGANKAEKTLVFSGKMSYHANVTAALHLVEEIMPHVWATDPAVQVQLVGKDPPARLRALATPTGSTPIGAVMITGAVPKMGPYLSQATIAVAPVLYGAGIQNKVLEAMACSTPVVASPQASSGLGAQPERDLLVAHNAPAFATAILRLLQNPAQRIQMGRAGRIYVEQAHAWAAVAAQLETLYAEVIAQKQKLISRTCA